jgi:hypothetical protein
MQTGGRKKLPYFLLKTRFFSRFKISENGVRVTADGI